MQPRDLSANSPYVPGRGSEEVARELGMDPADLVKLSSNENPHGPSPAAVAAIRETASDVDVYPTTAHADLTEKLADEWDLEPEQVWLSPGADGALDYLSRAMLDPGDRVLCPTPGFSYYPMTARYHHGTVAEYDLSKADDFAQTAEVVLEAYDGERIVYLTTPHNPAGTEFAREEITTLAESVEDHTLLVVDEAYGEYSERPSSIDLLAEYDNVAVTRTFSKAFGLAGLRVGWAAVPESWADAYARVNTPFATNEVACRAALAALDDDDHVEQTVETARWAREFIRAELDAPTWESAGNFVLAEVGDAEAVAEASQRAGVIVRDCSSFGLPQCIRISCGTRAETRYAVETLNEVLADLDAATLTETDDESAETESESGVVSE
ncbi:histidinol-phosphate transaminase [Salinirubrum litoreum]|uniref:Histidinol-phosphate aminotransferase n=1 Tax=Salinirubrum litoreum TaxID=1126234 RepID=A0ABD5R9F4_9EURY|nr:histidinol-phosphate transaminase [Salinirubrum litoreum]